MIAIALRYTFFSRNDFSQLVRPVLIANVVQIIKIVHVTLRIFDVFKSVMGT